MLRAPSPADRRGKGDGVREQTRLCSRHLPQEETGQRRRSMVALSGSPRRCRRASKGGWPMSSEAPIALLFGAGKVARGFLGHLLSRSGYSLWFVDKNAELVERLDAAGRYPL